MNGWGRAGQYWKAVRIYGGHKISYKEQLYEQDDSVLMKGIL
jgi:hypothetical protein